MCEILIELTEKLQDFFFFNLPLCMTRIDDQDDDAAWLKQIEEFSDRCNRRLRQRGDGFITFRQIAEIKDGAAD